MSKPKFDRADVDNLVACYMGERAHGFNVPTNTSDLAQALKLTLAVLDAAVAIDRHMEIWDDDWTQEDVDRHGAETHRLADARNDAVAACLEAGLYK